MFAGININEDYLSDEENSSLVQQQTATIVEEQHVVSVENNIVAINNIITAQEDDNSFILITKTDTTIENESSSIHAEETTVEQIVRTETNNQTSFHELDHQWNNEMIQNMERSFINHDTSVTQHESLSILTSEEIDTDDSTASSTCSPVMVGEDQIVPSGVSQLVESKTQEYTSSVVDESSTTKSIDENIITSFNMTENTFEPLISPNLEVDALTDLLAHLDPRNPKFSFMLNTGLIACLSLIVISIVTEIMCE